MNTELNPNDPALIAYKKIYSGGVNVAGFLQFKRGFDAARSEPAPLTGQAQEGVRENLGRIVREVWITWAKEQPNPKPSWLVPYDQLGETDKEVDRRIGERLYAEGHHLAPVQGEWAALPAIRGAIMLLVELRELYVPREGHMRMQIDARISGLQKHLKRLNDATPATPATTEGKP